MPDLYTGVIMPCLQASWILPTDINDLNISANGNVTLLETFLTKIGGKPSGPLLVFGLILRITLEIISGEKLTDSKRTLSGTSLSRGCRYRRHLSRQTRNNYSADLPSACHQVQACDHCH